MAKFPLNFSRHQLIIVTATLMGPENSHTIQLILGSYFNIHLNFLNQEMEIIES